MAADYKQPANVEKRVRFFDGQYLQDQDFIDEQKYQIDRQRRHHRTLHIAGIADGLEVKPSTARAKAGAVTLSVTAGTAIDQDGRQLALAQDQTVDLLLSKFKSKTASIYIVYAEAAVDPQKAGGIESDSRWQERPELVAEVKGQAITREYPLVLLSEVTLDAKGAITTNNALVREYSGVRLPGPGPSASLPTLRSDAAGRVTLAGGLAVADNVGIGTAAPTESLQIGDFTAGECYLTIKSSGGNQHANGIKMRFFDETYGFTIKNEERQSEKVGLHFVRHYRSGAGETALFIDTWTGNLGIGTKEPGALLHVKGSTDPTIKIQSDGGNEFSGRLALHQSNDSGADIYYDGTNAVEALRFDVLTRGTASPTAFCISNKTGTVGNVGIGTTDPSAALEVNGDLKTDRGIINDGGYGASWVGFSHKDKGTQGNYALLQHSNGTTHLNAASGRNLHFRINNADKMILDKDGNVGIGKIDPSTALHVVGTVTATQFVGEGAVPAGVIVMWSGTIATIPSLWALCDGRNGTPDLRNRFIVAAGSDTDGHTYYIPGRSGNPDIHNHSVTIPTGTFSTNWRGAHDHKFPTKWYNVDFGRPDMAGKRSGIDRGNENIDHSVTSQVGNHYHNVSVDLGSTNTTTYNSYNRPKWYALAFIMKL